MRILIWGEVKNSGPYDIFRKLDYKNVYQELIDNYHANFINVGNKVWIQGIVSALETPENELFFLNPKETWEEINCKYDKIVYSAANMLSKSYLDLIDNVAELFKNSRIPVYVIAIGAQTEKYENLNKLVKETERNVARFVNTIYSTGGEIACRGFFTKEYLDKIVKNTAVVTGCPSLFQNGRTLYITKNTEYFRPVFNGNAPFEKLANIFEESIYIDQDKYLNLTYDLEKYHFIRYLANNYSKFGGKAFSLFLDGRIKVFYDIPEWKRFLQDEKINFSMGSRIHGNVMSILSGIPSVILPIDSRTREMAEFYHIPTMESVEDYYNAKELFEKIDYSTFNKEYPKLFDAYNGFLIRCGLVKETNQKNLFWQRENPQNEELIVHKRLFLREKLNQANVIDQLYFKISRKFPFLARMKETEANSIVEKYEK